jgi:iron complex outermembrane receptor protein
MEKEDNSMKVIWLMCLSAIIGIVFTFNAVIAVAQDDEDFEFTLEEVKVTAQKREENLQKVAINMETISKWDLEETGAVNIMDALSGITFALVQQQGLELQVSMRGLDNDGLPEDSHSQVSVNVDGVYSESLVTGYTGMYDMERIEVLAGPQGTLYSKTSSGGVVNLVTAMPSDEFDASGSFELGSFNLMSTTGMLNTPISEKWAVRTAFNTVNRDGYISNGMDDLDMKSGRIKLGFTPNEDISFVMAAESTKSDGKGGGTGTGAGGGGVEFFEDEDDVEDPWTSNDPSDSNYADIDAQKYWANLNWDMGFGELVFLPSYHETDYDIQCLIQDRMSQEYEKRKTTRRMEEQSAELRMNSPGDSSMQWMSGIYYYEKTWFLESDPQRAYTRDHRKNYKVDESIAFFGNITYPASENLRLIVGGRYNMDERYSEKFSGLTESVYEIEQFDSNHFDYKLSVEYDISEQSMAWADHSTGFKQGREEGQDEILKSYQVGLKSRFLDSRLQFNITGFLYDYSDYSVQQSLDYEYEEDGVIQIGTDSGEGSGNAIMKGIDIQLDHLLTSNDRVDLSVSYLHARIDELIITDFDYMPDQIYDGGLMNNAPKWTVNLGYEHIFMVSNGGNVKVKVNSVYRSESQVAFFLSAMGFPPDIDLEALNTEPASTKTNANIVYSAPNNRWTLSAYVKNIENHATKGGFFMGTMRIGEPRTYGAILTIRY